MQLSLFPLTRNLSRSPSLRSCVALRELDPDSLHAREALEALYRIKGLSKAGKGIAP